MFDANRTPLVALAKVSTSQPSKGELKETFLSCVNHVSLTGELINRKCIKKEQTFADLKENRQWGSVSKPNLTVVCYLKCYVFDVYRLM